MARPTRTITVASVPEAPAVALGEKERAEIEAAWGDTFTPEGWHSMLALVHAYQFHRTLERNSPSAGTLAAHLKASASQVGALLDGFRAAQTAGVAQAMWEHLDQFQTSGDAKTGDVRGKVVDGSVVHGLPALRLSSRELVKELLALHSTLASLASVYQGEAPALLVTKSGEAWDSFARSLHGWAKEHGHATGITHNGEMLPFMRLVKAVGEQLPIGLRPLGVSPSAFGKALHRATGGGK